MNVERVAAPPAVLLALLLVAGCATNGSGKLSDAALSGDPDAMWAEGRAMATRGEKLVNQGEARVTKGRAQIREGEAMIHDGGERVSKHRREYESAAKASGEARTPKEVAAEADRLKAIGKRWADAIDTIRYGNALVAKGNANIDAGHAAIRQGRELIERGSLLMRNSERSRRGDDMLPLSKELRDTSVL